jgi:hypothetical protein
MPDESSNRLGLLRSFSARLIAASPRYAAETVILLLALSATEGVGLLMLVPLLQLVGVDTRQGNLGGIVPLVRQGVQRRRPPADARCRADRTSSRLRCRA